MVALLFTAIVTPYEIGLLETKMRDPFGNKYHVGLYFLNRIVDGVFLLDLFFNFFRQYVNELGRTVKSIKAIAENYYKGWLPLGASPPPPPQPRPRSPQTSSPSSPSASCPMCCRSRRP